MLLAALFIIPSYSYSADLGAVQLSLIEGDVQIYTEDTSDWVAAAINMPLREGDRIWVPEGGRAELLLNGGTALRLRENSAIDVLRIEDHSFQFYLDTGHAYINFRGPKGYLLQLDTPVSSIRAYDKGIFRVDIPDDRSSDISVDRGLVYAETNKGSTTVNEGYALSIRGDDYADLHPLEPSDGWASWNQERDRSLYEKRYSSRYLPAELSPYSYDFDRYGTWRYVPAYGHVWAPTLVVSAGWAPYRLGRWVWIAGDYVWISYEPWGWAPYHYGRWIFNVSFGWCWVPPVRGAIYWGPGFVSWVYTPDYVAWVPLAPRELYYGYGYYGPHSVNITNVNITNITVKKVYKNVYVNNAVTVVRRDTFLRGPRPSAPGRETPMTVQLKENPFLKERISVGRPAITPVKETRRPILREIKGGKQPSVRIREVKVEERKKERPLVPKKNYSVLRPGSPSKKMPLKAEKGKAPEKRVIEKLSRERKGYGVPSERKIERPEKQKAPAGIKKQFPEQKEIRPGPAEKEVPSKPERSKAPAERKMKKPRPTLERKEYETTPKKESEKPQKKTAPGKEKVVPEQKNPEQEEMERPSQRTRMERWGERPHLLKLNKGHIRMALT